MKHVFLVYLFFIFTLPLSAHANYLNGQLSYDAGNYEEAFKAWEVSAKKGDKKSQYLLGKLYEAGQGVPQDLVMAHVYYNFAASQGHKDAREARKAISQKMSKEQLAEAQKLVAQGPEGASADSPESLFLAADEGNVGAVNKLLESGAKVNSSDSEGWTALMVASIRGHLDVVKLLLKAGADVNAKNKDGATPVKMARLSGQIEVIKALVEAGAPAGDIFQMVEVGDVAGVKAFIERKGNVNNQDEEGWSLLTHASLQGHTEVVQLLLNAGAKVNAQGKDGTTPLLAASFPGHLEVVKILLDAGGDPALKNKGGVTPTLIAQKKGHSEIAKLLEEKSTLARKVSTKDLEKALTNNEAEVVKRYLDQGGDANKSTDTGTPILYEAIINGSDEVAAHLIKAGADVNNMTLQADFPLHAASERGNFKIVNLLLKSGADVSKGNMKGDTPLMVAVDKSRRNVVLVLLKHGVNANIPSTKKFSPIHLAVRKFCGSGRQDDYDIILILLKHGADPTNKEEKWQSAVDEIQQKFSNNSSCNKLLKTFKAHGFSF